MKKKPKDEKMNDYQNFPKKSVGLQWYARGLLALWSCLVIGSLTWNIMMTREEIISAARIQARVAYEKDIIYRRWNTGHGGVYVPVTRETKSNLYLSEIPDRDITTPSGKALTLMNPAYMTRQVHELAKSEYGVLGHITSLAPIRPQNAADPWETQALQAFEHGEKEVSAIGTMNGQEYMRLMRPLMTEKGCLKCHAAYGSREGEIRGGISVSVPMAPFWAIYHHHAQRIWIVHGLLWLMGLLGLIFGSRRLTKSEQVRIFAERSLRKSFGQLEAKVEERTAALSEANKELEKEIAERKHAEVEAQKAHRDWKNIFQAMGHPVMILDPGHRVISANRATTEFTGQPEKELIGKRCYEIMHGTKKPPAGCPMQKMMASGCKETGEMEVESFGRTFFVTCTPVNDQEGKLQKWIHIATDITQQKQAEAELRKHRDQLEDLVRERTEELEVKNAELERMNRLFVGREFRIKELKEKLKEGEIKHFKENE
jgi:PAS domain S-box-containing protein